MKKNLNFKISVLVTFLMVASAAGIYFIKNSRYSTDVFLHKATNNFENENFFQSARYYRKLISMGTESEEIYTNTAISLIKIGDYKKAIQYLNKALKKQISYKVYYLLGYSYYAKAQISLKESDFDKSIRYLTESIDLEKQDKAAYRLLGQIYEQLKQFEHARTWYRKALFEEIDNPSEFYEFIALTYFKENRLDDAKKYYQRSIDSNKNDISAYCSIGEIYNLENNFDKAKKYYKKAIKINPEYVSPYCKIGNLYYKKKRYDKALKWYKKALSIEKENHIVNYCIGMSYKNMNMLAEAIKYLKISAYCGNDDAVKELRTMLKTF